ncbi:OadG family protein [Parendozoicomonas haliclonae]|uniref:Probable oxaloacetate decarboxylase gamma chain n=1 Tax=Parendozoicomonas haliclonae TaxID=1960125 RepID=A0A1X7AQT5_9GAMM|nr:OadG family protein [Parendozoicomonas haliclonae]SMA50595.1 oxaloacetate decarboxylase subunit gamma [Parendozoicomonas haliclonae]
MSQEADLINEGLSLMMFGMGFVFVFLTVLVFATSLMSKITLALAPMAPEKATPNARPSVAPVASDPSSDPVLLSVINEAVRQHRARRQ